MANDYESFDHDGFWGKVRGLAGKLPLIRDVVAAYFAMVDPTTPMWAKVVIAGALLYFVTPFDVIPDFIFPAGYADDAAVMGTALATVRAFVSEEHYRKADEWLRGRA